MSGDPSANAPASPDASWRWFRGARGGLALLAVCLAVYLPGLFVLPPIDRDESRFAQATRQMVESGDWVVPRVQDRPRLNKPPLIYWVQGVSVRVFGDPPATADPAVPYLGNIWAFRVPSVLAAIGAAFLTWRIGLSMFGRSHLPHGGGAVAAWLAGAILAVCPIVAWDAHQARADQLLLVLTTAAMGALWWVWKESSKRRSEGSGDQRLADPGSRSSFETSKEQLLDASAPTHAPAPSRLRCTVPACLFWICLALAILAKGPIAPMVAGLTALALGLTTRRWRWLLDLRPALGVLIVAAIVAPWVYLVGERVGWSLYLQTILDETIGRSAEPKEGHWGPPGYHLILSVVLLWPGSLLTALAVRSAMSAAFPPPLSDHAGIARRPGLAARLRNRWRSCVPSAEAFLLAWAFPAWVVFELVSTKLPHYPMPLYPALALLSARAVMLAERGRERQSGLAGLHERGTVIGLWIWRVLAIPLSLPTFVLVWSAIGRGRFLAATLWAMLGWIIVFGVASHFVLPALADGSVRIEQARRAIDPDMSRPFASVDYHEDSLVFLTRGGLHKIDRDRVAAWAARHPNGLLVMWPHLLDSPDQLGIRHIESAPLIKGFNYSKGSVFVVGWYEPLAEPDSADERQ